MTFDILKGLKRGMIYGDTLSYIGRSLLYLIGIITIYSFWVFVAVFYSNMFFNISILIIKITRLSLILLVFGILFHYVCFFVHEITFKKKMKREEQNVIDATNSKTINKILKTS